jgi:hypothetical protein
MEVLKTAGGMLNFFNSLSNGTLIELAQNDWRSLELLCSVLTIDLQLLEEKTLYDKDVI